MCDAYRTAGFALGTASKSGPDTFVGTKLVDRGVGLSIGALVFLDAPSKSFLGPFGAPNFDSELLVASPAQLVALRAGLRDLCSKLVECLCRVYQGADTSSLGVRAIKRIPVMAAVGARNSVTPVDGMQGAGDVQARGG